MRLSLPVRLLAVCSIALFLVTGAVFVPSGGTKASAQQVGAGRVPLLSNGRAIAQRLDRRARRARPVVRRSRRVRRRRVVRRNRARRVARAPRRARSRARRSTKPRKRTRRRLSKYAERPFNLDFPKGSVVVINGERKLYYVTGKNRAIRYKVAVGNREELWTGVQVVTQKRKNPSWRSPDGGPTVRGGPGNPLGVRALYLGWTLWRIHGTPARGSIGRAVSNGCIRMLNEDVTDLYERVHIGAPVFVFNKRADAKQDMDWGRKVAQRRK